MTSASKPTKLRSSFRARIVLRPRSLDEVFDLALAYLRVYFSELRTLLVICTFLPIGVGGGLALGWLGLQAADILPPSGAVELVFAYSVILASALAEGFVTVFVGRHLFENKALVREAAGAAARKGGRMVAGTALRWSMLLPFALSDGAFDSGFATGAASLLLLTSWLSSLLLSRNLHRSEVVLLEYLSGSTGSRRAQDLSYDRQSRNLAFLLQSALLRTLFIGSVVGAVNALEFVFQVEGLADLLLVPAAMLGYAASGPYIALSRLFDYVDARTRGEGWDIQVKFQQIAHRAERWGEQAA